MQPPVRELEILHQLDPPMTGLANMSMDESMLDRIPAGVAAVIRVYRWSEPTLSLGHFQTIPAGNVAPWSGLPHVMRKTGGGAIVHHHELTYCIAIAGGSDAAKKGHNEALYREVHGCLVDVLRGLGWNAQLSETCTCKIGSAAKLGSTGQSSVAGQSGSAVESSPFLCFERRSPVDVVVDGYKIVGSAQRRTSRGLIQHGSVLLRHSEYAPHLPGLLEIHRSSASEEPKRKEWDHTVLNVDPNENWLVEILNEGVSRALSKGLQNAMIL
jgi:lipoate-protein ligase A